MNSIFYIKNGINDNKLVKLLNYNKTVDRLKKIPAMNYQNYLKEKISKLKDKGFLSSKVSNKNNRFKLLKVRNDTISRVVLNHIQ